MIADLRTQLEAALAERYAIERELPGGGMARVFVAEEHALGRKVVVKILSEELGSDLSLERFTREVKVAARLQHPNIVPVHSAGEAGGTPYYTMPFVRGESLRVRLAQGSLLSIEQAISVLRDVARALAHAHAEGVVHRDIKPENILLSGDVAVVADFGIAKAIDAARPHGGDVSLTQFGTSIGTPAYMAPEQAAGDPQVDHRADLYAWGLVAYECVTGAHPFAGKRTPVEIVTAHLVEQPVPVVSKRPECAVALADVIMSCLEKDPANRPASATGILAALQHASSTPSMPYLAVTPPTARESRGIAANSRSPISAMPSLAVLPFTNLTADPENEWLGDGIAEELMLALGQGGAIRVAGRTSSFAFKGKSVDLRTIGEQLHVSTILEGSVRRAGDRVRIGAQLSNATDGFQLWSARYDRQLDDIFAIQDDIASSIAIALETTLGTRGGAPSTGAKSGRDYSTHRINGEAFEHYVKGRLYTSQRGPGVMTAEEHYKRAIELQPDFALAYAGLADLHSHLGMYGRESPTVAFSRADEALTHAEALAPDAAEVMAARGLLQIYHDWVPAADTLQRAIARNPSIDHLHTRLAVEHLIRHRLDEAQAAMDRALRLEPLSAGVWAVAGFIARSSYRFDEAIRRSERAIELERGHWLAWITLAFVHWDRGDLVSAVAASERAVHHHPVSLAARLVHAGMVGASGDRARAERTIQEALDARRTGEYVSHWYMAIAHRAMDEIDAAIAELEAGYEARESGLIFLRCLEHGGKWWAPFRDDPRTRALVARFDDEARAKGHHV